MMFGILEKSYCYGGLMDEDVLLYVLYEYKGHLYRLENGKITCADNLDVSYINEINNDYYDEMYGLCEERM